jgi:hypothetical protein
MSSHKAQDDTLLRFPIDPNPQARQISQEDARIRLGNPPASFVNNQDVADLKPPETRDNSLGGISHRP